MTIVFCRIFPTACGRRNSIKNGVLMWGGLPTQYRLLYDTKRCWAEADNFLLDLFAGAVYILLDGSANTTSIETDQTALDAMALFQKALPAEFFEGLRKAAGQRPEKGVYNAAVVVLLII